MSRAAIPFPVGGTSVQQPIIVPPQQQGPSVAPLSPTDLMALLLNERRSQRDSAFDERRLALEEQTANRNLQLQESQFNEILAEKGRVGISTRRDKAAQRVDKILSKQVQSIDENLNRHNNVFEDIVKTVIDRKTGALLEEEALEENLPKMQRAIQSRMKKLDAEGRRLVGSKLAHFLENVADIQEDDTVASNLQALRGSVVDVVGEGLIGTTPFDVDSSFKEEQVSALQELADPVLQQLDAIASNASTDTLGALNPAGLSQVIRAADEAFRDPIEELNRQMRDQRQLDSEVLGPVSDGEPVFEPVELKSRAQIQREALQRERQKPLSQRTVGSIGSGAVEALSEIPQRFSSGLERLGSTPISELTGLEFLRPALESGLGNLSGLQVPTPEQIQAAGPQTSPFFYGGMR